MADESGIRTHAPEETGALNQRLRPLGHLATEALLPEIIGRGLNCHFIDAGVWQM